MKLIRCDFKKQNDLKMRLFLLKEKRQLKTNHISAPFCGKETGTKMEVKEQNMNYSTILDSSGEQIRIFQEIFSPFDWLAEEIDQKTSFFEPIWE